MTRVGWVKGPPVDKFAPDAVLKEEFEKKLLDLCGRVSCNRFRWILNRDGVSAISIPAGHDGDMKQVVE